MFISRMEGDALDRAEFAVSALEALSELISRALTTGEDMRSYESGVAFLFDPHLCTLSNCLEQLREQATEARRAEKAATVESDRVRTIRRDLISEALTKGIDPAEIANAMNMRRASIDSVIRKLRGEAGLAPGDGAAAVNG